jgi:hypothetical protein
MSTKSTEDKNLEQRSIEELQALFESTQKILQEKQNAIREQAIQTILTTAAQAGIKVFIRVPKKKDISSAKTYQHPEDSSLQWIAKPGAKPKWLSELLKNGHLLSDLEIKEQSA